MAKRRNDEVKRIIILFILAAVVVGGFAMIAFRNKPDVATPTTITAVQEVLSRSLDSNYPSTPKEVLKYYSEITRCFYSESYSEEELVQLAGKSRELLDDELRAQQSDEEYINDLKTAIALFQGQNRNISSYSISSATDIDYYRYENADWAKAICLFTVREGTRMIATQEEFLLRKDTDGHWKIFGWRLYDDSKDEK